MEKWKKIEGYEHYKVSTHGRVVNFKTGKVLSQYVSNSGYYRVNLWRNNKCKAPYIHQLVAKTFIKNKLGKPQVNHLDGVKFNNNVRNLKWCTNKENYLHALNAGLLSPPISGEDHSKTKLTNAQALEIRKVILNKTLTRKMISDKYGVSECVVAGIRNGRSFRHVK